jgi:hypothetical protein
VSTITRAAGARSRSSAQRGDAVEPRHREVEQHHVGRQPRGLATAASPSAASATTSTSSCSSR